MNGRDILSAVDVMIGPGAGRGTLTRRPAQSGAHPTLR